MAIFHCAVSHGSRKDGQSGAAKVAYIMRTGKYGRDPGELLGACAGHLPSWAGGNPRVFFAAADEYERSNGRLFTQVLFAIPNELSDQDALLMAYHYAEAATETGAPYALAVHRGGVEVPEVESAAAASEEADEEDLPPHNRHGHLVICERIDDGIERTARAWFRRANKKEPALGGAAKDREMNGGNWVPDVRFACAEYVNYALERAGFSERVTCESHETRIARAEAVGDEETAERLRLAPPGIHLGPTAWAIEKGRKGRKGRASWRGDLNRAITAEGEELRGKVEEFNAKLSQLDVQEEAVTEKLEAARRIAAAQFEQREEALLGTSLGGEILRAVRVEMVGDSAAPPSVVQLGEMLEVAEDRFGAALDLREAGFQETSVGSRYLVDATQSILGGEQSPTLPQRELIITTAESRLEQDLDRREATLRASVAGAEVLDTMQLEGADEYGSVLTLVQRAQLVETAGRRLERREAEEEVRRELDRREEVLRSVSLGAQYLSEAEQEGLGEGKRAAVLAARDALVTKAEQRLEADLSRRESDLVATSFGPALLREAFGERGDGDAGLSFAARDRGLEQVEIRVGEALRVQEEALRSIPFGRQCLPEETQGRSGDAEGVTAPLAERESRVRVAEQRVGEELARLEKEHVAKAGHDLLVEAAGALGDGRTFSLGERWEVYERAQSRFEEEQRKLDREEAAVGEDPAGAEFLRNARHEVIGAADREVTLAERARIVKAAAALQAAAEAKREAAAKQRAEQEREMRLWEEQRDAGFQALSCQPGGVDLYDAHLADLDPKWDRKQNDRSSREHIDAALAAAASDGTRLERLRVVLSNEVDAARYREELEKVAGQFKTSDLDRALAVVEQEREERATRQWEEQKAARVRREARHQMVSDTPGGDERLRAVGWEKARTDGMQDRVLATVERSLTADFNRREQQLRTDDEGKAFLRRGRVEVLEADREPETLAERGKVIERAEVLRQAERKRRATEQRVARLKRLFAVSGGDKVFFASLDARKPRWREQGTVPADVDVALDMAEQRIDRTKPATAEHEVVVNAEQTFSDAPSAAWRQAGDRFPKGSAHARVSQQLADRALAGALAAEREEPPASPALVQRLFTWLYAQVDKLLQRLGLVKRSVPSADELMNAFAERGEALDQVRMHFSDLDPQTAVPYVVMKAIDPQLLKAVLHPDEAARWTKPLNDRYEETRRDHPERFKNEVEPVWEAQRGFWVAPWDADELMNAFAERGEALDQVRMHFSDLDPQTAVPYVVMKAIDPQLLKAVLHPDEAARWTKPLNDRYEEIRRDHPERFKNEVEPVWEAQRGFWVAPWDADELMNAFAERGEALDQVRMHFSDLDPQTAVPYVVMKAIDPQLLKAVLHPDEAARWTKPLNDRYEEIRRDHPERFKNEVEPVWEAQRGFWVAPWDADELMNAFAERGEALDQVRMHFSDLDPQTAVPYVVMKAIDPQLLKAVLHPDEAARWTKPLNDRYEEIRRDHPERFKNEVEPVWEAQRGFWVAAGSQDLGPTSVTTPAPVTDPAGDEERAGTPGVPGQDGTATPAGDEEQAGTPGVPGQPGTATPARPRITVARGGERSDRTDTRDRRR